MIGDTRAGMVPEMGDHEGQSQGGAGLSGASPAPKPSAGPLTGPDAAAGPLVVSAVNPRYFTVASGDATGGKAVYLTGSHIWNSLHDGLGPGGSCAERPESNDYQAYLAFLKDHGHNFIRLWRWEHFRSQSFGKAFHLCMTPQPWPRTGPGAAADAKPRFDLSRFDEAYFGRLRDRVIAAGNAGCYVSVMLFEGWGLHLSPAPERRGPPVPRRQQHQPDRHQLDRRLPGPSAGDAGPGDSGGLPSQGGGHRSRPAQRFV
jgi:hypothetical protein